MTANAESTMYWPEDGVALTEEAIDRLISWASGLGASAIRLQSDHRIGIGLHGKNYQVTRRKLLNTDTKTALRHFFRSEDGASLIARKEHINISHCVWPDRRARRYSFRIQAHGCRVGVSEGMSIILRPLADIPRPLEEQEVEPELIEAMNQGSGFYPVCGPTGSGKTTLLGGFVRDWLEDPNEHRNIIEGSKPIEILYDLVKQPSSRIDQTEIGAHFHSFPDFIEAAVRSEPTDIIVGECNNTQTMMAALQGGISGHALLTSLHTNDPASTMQRIIGLCPPDQAGSMTLAAAEGMRVIVNQRLLPSTDGKRTPIRSFIRFNHARRSRLLDAPVERWPGLIREMVDNEGQSFAKAIARAHSEGRISDEVAGRASRRED